MRRTRIQPSVGMAAAKRVLGRYGRGYGRGRLPAHRRKSLSVPIGVRWVLECRCEKRAAGVVDSADYIRAEPGPCPRDREIAPLALADRLSWQTSSSSSRQPSGRGLRPWLLRRAKQRWLPACWLTLVTAYALANGDRLRHASGGAASAVDGARCLSGGCCMVLRKLGRLPAELESLGLFAQLESALGPGTTIRDPASMQNFLNQVRQGLQESLANPARLHGWRVQAMFEAMIVGLGSVRLITTEDTGDCYFDDAAGQIKLPDYRLVRADGERLLVEVKNVPPGQQLKPQRVNARELEGMQRYSELTGARLVLAHYWAVPGMWSVVDSSVLSRDGERLMLPLTTAMKANELEALGDAWIGTRPPLVLSLIADPSKPRAVRDKTEEEQEVAFTVGAVELSCAGRVLTDEVEKRIAWFLMWFGGWEGHKELRCSDDGKPERLDFVVEPSVPPEAPEAMQEVQMVGQLSSMYSALFTVATMTPEGEVTRLRHEPDPGMLADLIPSDYWSHPDRALPLWRFHVRPSIGPASQSVEPAPAS